MHRAAQQGHEPDRTWSPCGRARYAGHLHSVTFCRLCPVFYGYRRKEHIPFFLDTDNLVPGRRSGAMNRWRSSTPTLSERPAGALHEPEQGPRRAPALDHSVVSEERSTELGGALSGRRLSGRQAATAVPGTMHRRTTRCSRRGPCRPENAALAADLERSADVAVREAQVG